MGHLPPHVYDRLTAQGLEREYIDAVVESARHAFVSGDLDHALLVENNRTYTFITALLLIVGVLVDELPLPPSDAPGAAACDRCGESLSTEQLTRAAGSASCLDCTLATTTDDLARVDISAGLLRRLRGAVLYRSPQSPIDPHFDATT